MAEEEKEVPDVSIRVMEKINKEKVKIICPAVVWARKAAVRSAIFAFVLWGGFLANSFLYFLKHTRILKFLDSGAPGLKAFFFEIPYGYLALFFLAVILATYLAEKFDFCYQENISSEKVIPLVFLGSFLAGAVFLFLGAGYFLEDQLSKKRLSEKAVWGRVLEVGREDILIEEENGRVVKIKSEKYENPDKLWPDAKGKFLQAAGERKDKEGGIFQAELILCCDD